MNKLEQLESYWLELLHQEDPETDNWIIRRRKAHENNDTRVARITGKGEILDQQWKEDETAVRYQLEVTFFVEQPGQVYYHEEEARELEAIFKDNQLISNRELPLPKEKYDKGLTIKEDRTAGFDRQFNYDRRAAVQYAERWWNDYNPAYRKFEVDCTNYISQCLRAGGAPMRGAPNRSTGWWYSGDSWSYSFTVANAFRWYLSGSTQGLRGKEVPEPSQLRPGDVICYDFEGDGNWNHTTIVVAKDAYNMPLVNAHTANSRMRNWAYSDSPAWTENVQYKFFQIGE